MEERFRKTLKIGGIILGGLFLLALVVSVFSRNTAQVSLPGQRMATNSLSAPGVSTESFSGSAANPKSAVRPVDSQDAGLEISQDKKIIKNGNLSLKVEKTEKAADQISQIAKTNGGDVFSSNFYERVKGSKSGTVIVKVPVANFEKTIAEVKKVSTQVISESTTGQDVTEEYVDLQSQLKNQQALEQQYLEILKKAQKIEDILAVTDELSQVRGQIEQLQGRMKYLNSQSDMATISVSLSEDVTIEPLNESWRPWQVVKNAFKGLVSEIQGFVDGLIYFVIVVLPTLLVWLLVLWLLYKAGRKVWQKMKERA